VGQVGIDPERALWMTPREMSAAIQGHARSERTRFVTMARAFGGEISTEKAQKYINGEPVGQGRSPKEQEQKLQEIRERNGWD
jgi:hypothetical protein